MHRTSFKQFLRLLYALNLMSQFFARLADFFITLFFRQFLNLITLIKFKDIILPYYSRQNVSDIFYRDFYLIPAFPPVSSFFPFYFVHESQRLPTQEYSRVYIALIHREISRYTATRRRYRYYYIGNNFAKLFSRSFNSV